jgi:hypothetical protein
MWVLSAHHFDTDKSKTFMLHMDALSGAKGKVDHTISNVWASIGDFHNNLLIVLQIRYTHRTSERKSSVRRSHLI